MKRLVVKRWVISDADRVAKPTAFDAVNVNNHNFVSLQKATGDRVTTCSEGFSAFFVVFSLIYFSVISEIVVGSSAMLRSQWLELQLPWP